VNDNDKHYTTCIYCGTNTWRQGKAYGGAWGGYAWDGCSRANQLQNAQQDSSIGTTN